jgi:hypothetical protein
VCSRPSSITPASCWSVLSATTTSPMCRSGSSPPATPENTIRRQRNRSASTVATSAVFTLPIPGTDQHDLVPVEPALVEPGVRHLRTRGVGEGLPQVRQLLRDGADQADGHGRRLPLAPAGLTSLADGPPAPA